MRLDKNVVLITGAGSGIGAATALACAREGAHLVLNGRRAGPLEVVARAVRAMDRLAVVIPGDVANQEDCLRVTDTAVEEFGAIDVLFNNAGVIYRERPVHETSVEEWEETFAVNTTGTFLMCRAVLPGMMARRRGSIINNASCVGLAGGDAIAAYSASKGAVVLLTRSMARDYAALGIRVNCVCPGSIDTPMLDREMEEMGGAETILPLFAQKHPIGRVGTSEEVAAAVVFLASADASFVTGASIPIDGGRLA